MVSRRTDRLLQDITHHTNLEQPYNDYITGLEYPEQDSSKLGTFISMKYRNRYKPKTIHNSSPDIYEPGPRTYIEDEDRYITDIYEEEFIVLRYDIAPPYKLITVNKDYKVMLIGDTRTYEDIVHIYPKQIEEYLGLYMHNQYVKTPGAIIKSVLLRCDSTEGTDSIIAELYLDNTVRFVTGTEVQSVVLDRYDPDESKNFDGIDPTDHPFVYIDLNGKFASNEGELITVDADGGRPDPLADLYRKDILTLPEVQELRGRLLAERRIYGDIDINVRGVSLDSSFIYIESGNTYQLTATIIPENATNQNVTWTSSNPSIATVDDTGLVTVLTGGIVNITVTTEDGGYKASCKFKVVVEPISITITNYPSSIEVKDEFQLEYQIYPDDSSITSVLWSSSDNSIISVNSDGKIKGVSKGQASITATIYGTSIESTVAIDCTKADVPVDSFLVKAVKNRFDGDYNIFLPCTDTDFEDLIIYKFSPLDATNTKVYWSTSSDIITLSGLESDEGGLYSDGVPIGHLPKVSISEYYTNASIIAKTVDGDFTREINVIGRNAIKGIRIKDPGDISRGETGVLKAVTQRENINYDPTNTNVFWTSDNDSMIRFTNPRYDSNSKMFIVDFETIGYGVVNVTVTTETDYYGSFSDTFSLNITSGFIPITGITVTGIEDDTINLSTNGTNSYPNRFIVHASVQPEDASIQEITAGISSYIPGVCKLETIDTNTFRITGLKYDVGSHSTLILEADDSYWGGTVHRLNISVNVTDYISDISIPESFVIDPFGANDNMIIDLDPVTGAYVSFDDSHIATDFTVTTSTDNNLQVFGPDSSEYYIDYNKLRLSLTGVNPGITNLNVSGIDKDGNIITKTCEVSVGRPITNITVDDHGINWKNVEIGDIYDITINVAPSYYEYAAEISLTSSDPSLIQILEKTGSNTYKVKVVNKGNNCLLNVAIPDIIDNTDIKYYNYYIDQIGTHHYASNIETDGEIVFPMAVITDNDTLYARVDGDVGVLLYNIDKEIPFNIVETVDETAEYKYKYQFVCTEVEFSSYGSAVMELYAADPDPSIGDVKKYISIKWGNPIVGIEINEVGSDMEKNVLYGDNFPVSGNLALNITTQYPTYPPTINTFEWESSNTSVIIVSGNTNQITYDAYKPGSSSITVTSTDGSFQDTKEVNIYGVMFEQDQLELLQRDEYQLEPVCHLPSSYANGLIFSIRSGYSTTVAEVTDDGYVTAIDPGTTMISVYDSYSLTYNDNILVITYERENPLASLIAENSGSAYTYTDIDYGDIYDPTKRFSINEITLHVIGEDNTVPCTYPIENINVSMNNYYKNPRYTGFIADFDHFGELYDIEKHDMTFNLYNPGIIIFNVTPTTGWQVTSGQIIIYGFRFDNPSTTLVVDDTLDLNDISFGYVPSDSGTVKFITYDIDSGQSVNTDIIDVVQSGDEYVITDGIINARKEGHICIKGYYANRPETYDILDVTIRKNPEQRCVDIEIIHNYPSEPDEFFIKDQTDIRNMTFKQIDQNGDYFLTTVDVNLSIVENSSPIILEYTPGSGIYYPSCKIKTEDPLLSVGTATMMITSFDGNCTKSFRLNYGNQITNTYFPSEYSNYQIDLANPPQDNKFKLNVDCTYMGYIPSSNCTWSSSNPSVITVSYDGYIDRDSSDHNYVKYFTTFNLTGEIGTSKITATTSNGSVSFDITIYDSVTPVKKSFLNIHEINMIYTNDPLQYQLSIIDPELASGTVSYSSDDIELATVNSSGLVTITEVPARTKFEYIDSDNNPKVNVYIEFYIRATVNIPTATYIDECKIHIKGESLIVQSAQVILVDAPDEIDIGDEETMQIIATPYYLKDNDNNDTIVWNISDDNPTPEPLVFNNSCRINATVTINTVSDQDIIEIHENDFNFGEIPENLKGYEYDMGELGEEPSGEDDYNFGDTLPESFVTEYDTSVDNRTYEFRLNNPKNMYGLNNNTATNHTIIINEN